MPAAPLLATFWRALGLGQGVESAQNLAHLLSTVLPSFFLTTVWLALGVLGVVLVAGVGSAWLIAAYDFPLRSWLSRLLVLPLAIPGFVMAYAYTDFLETTGPVQRLLRSFLNVQVGDYWFPDIRSTAGAALMLGLALYPYVYMLARPAFAERNAALGEAAQTLGYSSLKLWWRVTLPVARPAIVAACALVLMETLADFGTVSYFAVDTLAAGIYRTWQGLGDQVSAARLSLLLLIIIAAVLAVEKTQRGRMASHGRQQRPVDRRPLTGAKAWAASVFCTAWVFAGFVLPCILLVNGAITAYQDGEFALDSRFMRWGLNSAFIALLGTLVIIPSALLVGYAVRLQAQPWIRGLAGIAASGYAVPGLVIAVGLLVLARGFDSLGLSFLRATVILVVLGYTARFFAVAYQSVTSGLTRIAPSLDDSARCLGSSPAAVLRKIHWPLLKPTIGAATLLVFVDCLKELPATLVLRPFNYDTLAVMAYQYANDERLAAAAAPALALVIVGLLPTWWLARDHR